MSLFITFEGGEGSGKSNQTKLLYKRLLAEAVPAVLLYEPGVTPLGKRISHLLKWGGGIAISPMAELFLFNAARTQLINDVILPELSNGKIVICDRYADSTTVYQSYGRGLDSNMVKTVNETATLGLKPDITILLDLPGEEGMARKTGQKPDRFEQESISFRRKIRRGYLELAEAEPYRWFVVDASQPKKTIGQIIWDKVSRLIIEKKDCP